jgi:hypothetical protein
MLLLTLQYIYSKNVRPYSQEIDRFQKRGGGIKERGGIEKREEREKIEEKEKEEGTEGKGKNKRRRNRWGDGKKRMG